MGCIRNHNHELFIIHFIYGIFARLIRLRKNHDPTGITPLSGREKHKIFMLFGRFSLAKLDVRQKTLKIIMQNGHFHTFLSFSPPPPFKKHKYDTHKRLKTQWIRKCLKSREKPIKYK